MQAQVAGEEGEADGADAATHQHIRAQRAASAPQA